MKSRNKKKKQDRFVKIKVIEYCLTFKNESHFFKCLEKSYEQLLISKLLNDLSLL